MNSQVLAAVGLLCLMFVVKCELPTERIKEFAVSPVETSTPTPAGLYGRGSNKFTGQPPRSKSFPPNHNAAPSYYVSENNVEESQPENSVEEVKAQVRQYNFCKNVSLTKTMCKWRRNVFRNKSCFIGNLFLKLSSILSIVFFFYNRFTTYSISGFVLILGPDIYCIFFMVIFCFSNRWGICLWRLLSIIVRLSPFALFWLHCALGGNILTFVNVVCIKCSSDVFVPSV